jgi:hypothetical protein
VRKAVQIECVNRACRARYLAVLADDPPEWDLACVECDTPFRTVQGQEVYYLFAPCDLQRLRRRDMARAEAAEFVHAIIGDTAVRRRRG